MNILEFSRKRKKNCIELKKSNIDFLQRKRVIVFFNLSPLPSPGCRKSRVEERNHKDLWLDINLANYRGRTEGGIRIVSHPLAHTPLQWKLYGIYGYQFSREGGLPGINTKNRPTGRKQRPQISTRLFKRGAPIKMLLLSVIITISTCN